MKISILGMGAYGIALARVFCENDNKVSIWSKFKDEADIVKLKRENINVFPGIKIPRQIDITSDLKESVENAKIIVIAVPMNAVRDVCKELSNYITKEQVICIASKGIETGTNQLMSEVVFEETKSENICMLSGPSFAIDLVRNNDIGLTVASESSIARTAVKICLENSRITVNLSRDIIGVQVSASVKNVFAIILGMLDGMKKSESTRAKIFTLLADDLRIIIEIYGGKAQTMFTYAGIGDLFLTCLSPKSRNYTFGKYLGQGLSREEALDKMTVKTVEGLYSLSSLKEILEVKEIEIKSINAIYGIVYNNEKIDNFFNNMK